jgi:NAD(P)-dependent dehydrogenase (short-subunit alcohol dehydrogenase family)
MMNTIVMTGGTSGLGEVAARRFIETPNTRLLLGARRRGPLGAETLPLDLMRLENVRSFASAVDRELGPAQINSLVLNAGLLFPNDDTRSADGFEAAFAVNHLAHYLLLRLLLPRLAQGATVILTTSGTHDPAEKTIMGSSSRLRSMPMRGFSRTRSATPTATRTRRSRADAPILLRNSATCSPPARSPPIPIQRRGI